MPATLGFIMNGGKALTLEVSISTDGEEDTDDEAQKTLSEQGVDKAEEHGTVPALPEPNFSGYIMQGSPICPRRC